MGGEAKREHVPRRSAPTIPHLQGDLHEYGPWYHEEAASGPVGHPQRSKDWQPLRIEGHDRTRARADRREELLGLYATPHCYIQWSGGCCQPSTLCAYGERLK